MPQTRHKSGGIDPAVVFPDLSNFSPPTKLPTNRSVVGVLQNVIKGSKGANQISTKDAVREVAKRVYAKLWVPEGFVGRGPRRQPSTRREQVGQEVSLK